MNLSVIEEDAEGDLENGAKSLDRASTPSKRTQTASVQTSENVSIICKSRLREKSIQTKNEGLQNRNASTISEIDLTEASYDDVATQIQAGFRGMIAREKMKVEENEIRTEVEKKNQAIEKHLGIDLSDPEVIAATTKLQAGFRGYHARMTLKNPLTPSIFISKPAEESSELGSEYTYIYEDEEDTDDDLESRPDSPRTAVEQYPFTIGGFTPTFGIRF